MELLSPHLRTFLVVARRLSFSQAAKELYLTQPAVSAQIHKLERAVGTPLFRQLGRIVGLTSAGSILYQYAERMLALEDELRGALADVSDVCEGPLAIGANNTVGVNVLPALLRRFLAEHPRVTLRLQVDSRAEVVRGVLEGRLDLGLVTGGWQDDRLVSRPFIEDELILIVPPCHRWAGLPAVDREELAREPLILRPRGTITRTRIEQEFGAVGTSLNVVAEMNNNQAIARAVEMGLGVSILSKYAVVAELDNGSLWSVPIAGMRLRRAITLLVQRARHQTPAMRAFGNLLRQPNAESARAAGWQEAGPGQSAATTGLAAPVDATLPPRDAPIVQGT